MSAARSAAQWLAVLGLMLIGGVLGAQEQLTARLGPSGLVQVRSGQVELAVVELNAHGPGWQHAPQSSAAARMTALPGGAGWRFEGTLPIPNTDGRALRYTQTVRRLDQGLQLEYDVAVADVVRLNGLQVSVLLPVDRYGGQEVVITAPQAETQIAALPRELKATGAQIWSGQGARVEVAAGGQDAVTVELKAATDVVIQDLRQWDRGEFEIRFPAILEEGGREVTAEDRFHLELTVVFARPLSAAP